MILTPSGFCFLGQPLRIKGYPKKPQMILKIAEAIFVFKG